MKNRKQKLRDLVLKTSEKHRGKDRKDGKLRQQGRNRRKSREEEECRNKKRQGDTLGGLTGKKLKLDSGLVTRENKCKYYDGLEAAWASQENPG